MPSPESDDSSSLTRRRSHWPALLELKYLAQWATLNMTNTFPGSRKSLNCGLRADWRLWTRGSDLQVWLLSPSEIKLFSKAIDFPSKMTRLMAIKWRCAKWPVLNSDDGKETISEHTEGSFMHKAYLNWKENLLYFKTFKPFAWGNTCKWCTTRLFAAKDCVLIPSGLVYREGRTQTSELVVLDVNPN